MACFSAKHKITRIGINSRPPQSSFGTRSLKSPSQWRFSGSAIRFINHIPSASPETLAEILRDPPTCPSNLPLSDFVYQSTFTVPNEPFGIRIIKVMQPSVQGMPQSSGLFLDCDVFSTKSISCERSEMDDALVKMRWLKNKIFFSLLTDQTVQSFK